ncbi:MAG: hypothetical protein WD971_08175 [Pirellulales bacterium]
MRAAVGWGRRRLICASAICWALLPGVGRAHEWLERVPLATDRAELELSEPPVILFLNFGRHSSFAPDEVRGPDGADAKHSIVRDAAMPIGLFQELTATPWRFPASWSGKPIELVKGPRRDPFWDQVLVVDRELVGTTPRYTLVETGEFGQSLPAYVRDERRSAEEILRAEQSLTDPVIPAMSPHEITWSELAAAAYPLDFQKVLLASRNDASPAFAYQNGQWFTTWLSHDLPKWTKEDHWFAPALLVGDTLVRPAPLSAETDFVTTEAGVTLPMWTLRWRFGATTVTQWMFSHRTSAGKPPSAFVRFRLENAPPGARLALGMGRRPNCHYWDDKGRERSPVAFLTLAPDYRRERRSIVDGAGKLILASAQDVRLEAIGPVETLAIFVPDAGGNVYVRTPQTEVDEDGLPLTAQIYDSAEKEFVRQWCKELRAGARVSLPSAEWMQRIDVWQSQVAAITRVKYQGRERLSYGANFYQAYFGPEEGWPIVALAQWGRGTEAKRQAEIMLSAENRDKSNVHHQSRNGTSAWYAAEVARLTQDAAWLDSIALALIENAEWTIAARKSTQNNKSPLTRGLLPAHIYGGDVRDPATSLYASMVCYKGLVETADVFHTLGTPELKNHADKFDAEAREFRERLAEVMNAVVDEGTEPPFLPLALELASLEGKNEGPYERLTASRLGNYWNLFAPSVLELGLTLDTKGERPNGLLFDYMAAHGGLWAALPRFNAGLDAAYSIGVLRELQRRSMRDVRYRHQALAGLEAFFLHAASRNGYTIPEVAGLFPDRLDRAAYERLVRESPWSFGMYDDERYLGGHISFTEPLGAAAGEALWLVRDALVCEERDENGLANGELFLLSTVPSKWFAEGKEIVLDDFPTAYGKISVQVRSRVASRGEVKVEYQFDKLAGVNCDTFWIRIAPPGRAPKDIKFSPDRVGTLRVAF